MSDEFFYKQMINMMGRHCIFMMRTEDCVKEQAAMTKSGGAGLDMTASRQRISCLRERIIRLSIPEGMIMWQRFCMMRAGEGSWRQGR